VNADGTLLVVGGGAAAHACLHAYRESGGDRPVVLVSADDRLPYFRPHVSKEHLAGDVPVPAPLSPPDWYAANDVDMRLGCAVTSLDCAGRTAATTASDPLRWERCVLATGSDPASLPVAGSDDPAVSTLRTAADAERLLTRLSGPVVIVGSGFVGCEAAASLRRRGCDVTVVAEEAQPQQDRLGEWVGGLIAGWLRDLGVRLIGGSTVVRFERDGDALRVVLPEGPPLEACHVVAAVGARPRRELAAAAGLTAGDELPVDTAMQTTFTDVLAVGDIATAWHTSAGRPLRVEHWGDAEAQGRVAGLRLAGHPAAWTTPPGFWSTIAGETIKHVAWGDGYDQVAIRTSAEGETAWYGRDGIVVGVLTHGHDEDAETAAAAIAGRRAMPAT
jgi:3-phenylpropionate/trans-cinnamate dioxygenase ferredoxin reductase component